MTAPSTTLLKTTLSDSDAHLDGWRRERTKGTNGTILLERYWPDVHAAYTDTLVANIPTTRSDPKADAQTYGGTFDVVNPRADGQDDRSVTVRETLVQSDSSGLTLTWRPSCDANVSKQYLWDQTRAKVTALYATYAGSSTNGVTVQIAENINELKLFDVVITTTTRLNRESLTNQVTLKTDQIERREWQEFGITSDSQIKNIDSAITGTTRRQVITVRDDCSKDVITREDAAIADSAAGLAGGSILQTDSVTINRNLVAFNEAAGDTGVLVSVRPTLTETGRIDYIKARQIAQAIGPKTGIAGTVGYRAVARAYRNQTGDSVGTQGAQGVTNSLSPVINQFGRVDFVQTTRTASALDSKITDGASGYTDSIYVYKSQTSMVGGAGGQGKTVSLGSIRLNDDDTVDYTRHIRSASALDTKIVDGTVGYTDSVFAYRNQTSISVGAGAQGKTISVSGLRLRDDDTIDLIKSTRVAVALDSKTTDGALGYTDSIYVFRNQTSITAGAGDTQGKTVSVSSVRLRDDDTIDFIRTTRVVSALDSKTTDGTVGYTDSIYVYRNQTSISGGAGTKGKTVNVSSVRLRDDDTIDFIKSTRVVAAIDSGPATSGQQGYIDSFYIYRHQSALPTLGQAAAGKEYHLGSINLAEDKTLDYLKRVRVYDTRTVSVTSYATRYGNAYVKHVRHGDSSSLATDEAALTDSTINTVSPYPADNGKVDYIITKRPFDGTSGGARTWDSSTVTGTVGSYGREITRTKKIKYFAAASGSSAATFVSGANNPTLSDMFPVGPMWKAIKVSDTWT